MAHETNRFVGFADAAGDWAATVDAAVQLRHHLHQHPELTWQETHTAGTLRAVLDALQIRWRPCARTGTVATLAPQAPGRHVALRGDIDALPIAEETGLPWASTQPGCMHACGHDGHAATLMVVAAWLGARREALPGPVTLLFQPAEEGGHGAREMIAEGALQGVDVVYGWHNWPAIPFGRAVCPDGTVMAGNGTFRITVQGQGGHASQPEACRDPVLAASAITMALQQVVSRRLRPQHATVLSVTWIDAPSGDTVIPDQARLGGSFRIARAADREPLHRLIAEVARSTAEAYGTRATVELFGRYDATVNHAGEAAHMRAALTAELGAGWADPGIPVPIMASEDFSYYLQHRPGAFALIGADDGEAHAVACHSPRYDFNDRLIEPAARVLARLGGVPVPTGLLPGADGST